MEKRLLILIHPIWIIENPSDTNVTFHYLLKRNYDFNKIKTYFDNLEKIIKRFDNVLLLGPDPKKTPEKGIGFFFKGSGLKNCTRADLNRLIKTLASKKIKRIGLPNTTDTVKKLLQKNGDWEEFLDYLKNYNEIYIAGGNLFQYGDSYTGCLYDLLHGLNEVELELRGITMKKDGMMGLGAVFSPQKIEREIIDIILIEDAVFPIHEINIDNLLNMLMTEFYDMVNYELSKKTIKEL